MSSPGTYPRCSAKSTDAPKYGALCRPLMKPSTTARETSSRFPMRASTTGSMNRAPGIAWISTAMSHTGAREWYDFEQPIDDLVGRHAFRLRVEVRDDAVPHHGMREGTNVLEAHVV